MKHPITIYEKYGPAMAITDQAAADAYFEECVQHNLESRRMRGEAEDRKQAEYVERANLGYFAGYGSHETRARVERLFRCSHPVFGPIAANGPPTAEEALRKGIEMAKR